MKIKNIFLVIFLVALNINIAISQITPSITRAYLLESDRVILDQHLKEYSVFTIDKRELIDSLYTFGKSTFLLNIDIKYNWTITIELNDMRSQDFRQTYTSEDGEFEYNEPFIVNTFKGITTYTQVTRFTIDENNFFGVILDNQFHYVIRPAKDYTKNIYDESYIVYKSYDIIEKEEYFDYINDALEAPIEDKNEIEEKDIKRNLTSYTTCTFFLRIATEADFHFYQSNGSNLTNTYNRIFSVLNIVEGVYESTFNMKFIITYQNVFTTNSTYTSTNASDLLNQFRNHWNSNMKTVSRNIAHMFTGKSLGSNLGIAWKGQLNNPNASLITNTYAYGLSSDHNRIYAIATHEIGHNLNADHAPVSGPPCLCDINTSSSIMCPFLTSAPNIWFCNVSINEIRPFISNRISHLYRNLPNSHTLSGSVTGFKSYEAVQSITSTQVINSGLTSYKAGNSITLKPGFHAKEGSIFSASLEDNSDCIEDHNIYVHEWVTTVWSGSTLYFQVINATHFNVLVFGAGWGYIGGGFVSGDVVPILHVPSTTPASSYTIDLTFHNQYLSLSKTYPLIVLGFRDYGLDTSFGYNPFKTIFSENQFNLSIHPNPNSGNFIIELETKELEPFTIEIFDSSGMIVSKTDYCDTYKVNVSQEDLPSGVYYVRVSMGGNVSTKKIVVQ